MSMGNMLAIISLVLLVMGLGCLIYAFGWAIGVGVTSLVIYHKSIDKL